MIDNLLNKLCVFIEEKSCPISITELIAFSITRPFNMKGQEFENKISYMLQSAIKECEEIKNDFSECFVTTYNNKSAKDLMISYKYQEDELMEVPFSVKNYTIDRFQLSTFAKKLDFFKESYIDNLSLAVGDFLTKEQVESFKKDILNKFDNGITLFGLSSIKSADFFTIENFKSEDELTNLVEKIEEDFAITLDKKDLLHSLNVFCYEQNFNNLSDDIFGENLFIYNKESLIKKYKSLILKTKPLDENLKVDIFLKTLNKTSFLDGIDVVQLHKTKGTTSHFKFLMFNSSVDKEFPMMTFDLGTNPLNRGLWFCSGKKFFYNKNVKLESLFNNIIDKRDVDLGPWMSISENEKIENELNFLSQKKTKFYLSQTVGSNDYKKTLLRKLTP